MKLALTGILFAAALSAQVTVHEWGTFAAALNPDGDVIAQMPPDDETGLPCFAYRLPSAGTSTPAAIRLESSALAFYTQQPATLHVRLDLPQAWVTAWYPRAASYSPDGSAWPAYPRGEAAYKNGRIEWKELAVLPGADLKFHREQPGHAASTAENGSRYYTARETDAAPVRTRHQPEKMIFYRGLASFEAALRARIVDNKRIELRNTGESLIGAAIVFESRDGRVGYRILRDLGEQPVTATLPANSETNADAAGLHNEIRILIQRELRGMGLFEKEAAALLAAWGDSWFEPGLRVLYFVPPADIGRLLPLTIAPAPASVTRAYVGRLEILTQPPPEPVRAVVRIRQSTDAFNACDPNPR